MLRNLIKDLVHRLNTSPRAKPGSALPANDLETLVQSGKEHIEVRDWDAAERIFNQVLCANPDRPDGLYWSAMVARQRGRLPDAISRLKRALRAHPGNPDYHYQLGETYAALGNTAEAISCCEKALALHRNHSAAHFLMAAIRLPGENYLQVMRRIHAYLKPRSYVEIGVSRGDSFALAGADTIAIGVDPAPEITYTLPPPAKVFRKTSDEFFSSHDLRAELQGRPVQLAFIDGLHLFEYALRDFMNLEKYCAHDSAILIHDCYPLDRITAERERQTNFWSGDVWKLIVCLKKYRPDLAIHTIAAAPTGLAVIKNLNPASKVIEENLERLYSEYICLDYSALGEDKEKILNLTPNDGKTLERVLTSN